ncbi:ABC transporter substrate-binding protein [Bradyrhizobium sp. WSM1417]|uniref:ABC transporter substrate-binding protein n=1 Tax=Bradyrhizobium sp. WSM1417 TaxID=754500 RepID=UPI0004B503FF|nr:ABC transporter substrate-binding protein [Bradyrhizobium sp. WSM1417]
MVNWLAESWSIEGTPDEPIIDVHLRKGVKFHNGDPLTSADFEFSYERLRDPKISRFSYTQANIEKFEIVDDHHFKLHFKAPDGNYIPNALQLWAIPKKYFEKVGEEGFAKAPVGTGPWKFVSRSIKEDLKLEAFDDYWNKDARPKIKNLVLKIIPEDLTRVAAFKSGAVDWIDTVPLSAVEEFKKMPGVTTLSTVANNNLYIEMTADKPDSPLLTHFR